MFCFDFGFSETFILEIYHIRKDININVHFSES